MELEDWDVINARLHDCLQKVDHLPQYVRRDCRRMADTVLKLLREADQERVICRRRGCVTTGFCEKLNQAQEALLNFEGHVVFASLLKDPQ